MLPPHTSVVFRAPPTESAPDTVNPEAFQTPARIEIRDLSVGYGSTRAVRCVSLTALEGRITALIGPGGSGKSSLLRCLNRMNDPIPGARVGGTCRVGGIDVLDPGIDLPWLRRRVGMVFQDSTPFPLSVFENVAFGLRLGGCYGSELEERVSAALQKADLWKDLRDRLRDDARGLPEGRRRRLCIARSLAVDPVVLLVDEPAGTLDPVSSAQIEELIRGLRSVHTVVVATRDPRMAARLSDQTAFLDEGVLVEMDDTVRLFSRPRDRRTERYLTGGFN